jgi:hypothetical protein
MTALIHMITGIRDWMSEHALGVGGYSAFSFVLGQVNLGQQASKMLSVLTTISHVNIVIAFAIGIVTLSVKGIEFYEKIKKLRNKKEDINEAA